ncbi:MAG: hypothetical protein AB1505_21395 [Candidatus Latescibacterota bacterium]
MSTSRLTYLLVPALLAVAGCDGDNNGTSSVEESGPGAYQADFRNSAQFFTRMSGLRQGTSPHGKSQIWYSRNVQDRIAKPAFSVPEGTTAIKTFDSDGVEGIDGLAVMVKREAGYDAEHNDWYYEMRDPSGAVMADPPAGATSMCVSCHAGCADRDYLCGTQLR